MMLPQKLAFLKDFFIGFFMSTADHLREEAEYKNSQYDPDAEFYFQMLDAEAQQEEDLEEELDTFQRLEAELSEGEFACTISGSYSEGWDALADLDYQEIIEAGNFEQVIAILSDRYHSDYTWTVSARDWNGNTYKHHCAPEDSQHDYFYRYDVEPCFGEFACLISPVVGDDFIVSGYAGNLVFIRAEEFSEVIRELTARRLGEGPWTVLAMDWNGERYRYEHIECKDVEWAVF